MTLQKVTDPALLAQLNAGSDDESSRPGFDLASARPVSRRFDLASAKPVTDPALLAQLNAPEDAPPHQNRNEGLATLGRKILDLVNSGAAGFNSGVAYLAGLPVDATQNIMDLSKAGIGSVIGATGHDIPDWAQVSTDRSGTVGSGEYIRSLMNKLPGAPAQIRNPQSAANRYAYAMGTAVPAAASDNPAAVIRAIPRTVLPAAAAQAASDIAPDSSIAPVAAALAGAAAPSALNAARNRLVAARAQPSAEEILARVAQDSNQSMGAAAAAPNLTNVSPELKDAVVAAARKTGGAINPQAFARQSEADTLPVRIRLTEGQATQNPVLLSNEQNLRGKHTQLADHFAEQNRQLGENIQTLRDEVGPNVFSTNPIEHSDTLIAAYKAKNDAAQADISAKYQALRDANGGAFPVDAGGILKNATAQLHDKLLFEHAPASVMGQLDRMAKDGMNFEQFEAMRTNLATIQRTATDGLERRAAGVIRSEMEKLPLEPGASKMKSLADDARSAAKAQFDALDADPAYSAAVNDTVPPDRFVNRFVINAPRDDVALMRSNLADDETATQTMSVAALDHLRSAARLDPSYTGNFSAPGYNKALQNLTPKLPSLLSPEVSDQLEKLGNVARYTTAQPRGSFVNNSNTFVSGAADYGASAVEGAANVAAHGVPVGTWGRKAIQAVRTRRNVERALAPGAGLDRLNLGGGGLLSRQQ